MTLRELLQRTVDRSNPMDIVGDIYDLRFEITVKTIEEFFDSGADKTLGTLTADMKLLLGSLIYWLKYKEREHERKHRR